MIGEKATLDPLTEKSPELVVECSENWASLHSLTVKSLEPMVERSQLVVDYSEDLTSLTVNSPELVMERSLVVHSLESYGNLDSIKVKSLVPMMECSLAADCSDDLVSNLAVKSPV